MTAKVSPEMQIRALERSFASIVKVVKEMKASMDKLEKRVEETQMEKIEEIIKAQKNVDELLVANSKELKRIDGEILGLQTDKANAAPEHVQILNETKKCRYFNRGHCRYKDKCKFLHTKEICKSHLEGGKCSESSCMRRHPKVCKWWQRGECRRTDCNYLHVTLVCGDGQKNHEHENFPCFGCRNVFEDKSCVVQHNIENTILFLCLNCNGWIQHKEIIIHPGWSLFDMNGELRRDV